MNVSKSFIEQECCQLQEQLKKLTTERDQLKVEFGSLSKMYQNMTLQLKNDTIAGEGQLHAFQREKDRVEERLEQLEDEILEKNKFLSNLDTKASDYLLQVTTASNSIYDDSSDRDAPDIDTDEDAVRKIVREDMIENEDLPNSDYSESRSTNRSFKSSRLDSESDPDNINQNKIQDNEDKISCTVSQGIPEISLTPSTVEQIQSLSCLIQEFRALKEDMGRCLSARSSINELENRLSDTQKELSCIKGSMSDVGTDHDGISLVGSVRGRLSNDGTSRKSSQNSPDAKIEDEKMQSRSRITSKEDRDDILDEVNHLSDHSELSNDSTFECLESRSISCKVANIERNLETANNKLLKSKSQIQKLLTEREQKQLECESLKKKVNKVEKKMSKLQSTFDELIQKMMKERESLLDNIECKVSKIRELEMKILELTSNPPVDVTKYVGREEAELAITTLKKNYCDKMEEIRANHVLELEKLRYNAEKEGCELKKKIENLLNHINSLEINNEITESLKTELFNEQTKVKNLEVEINTKVSDLDKNNSELTQMNLELSNKIKLLEKSLDELSASKNSVELENMSLTDKIDELNLKLEDFEKLKTESETNNKLKADVANLDEQCKSLQTLTEKVSGEMCSKQKEYQEELRDREATIRELRITVQNNQKQSTQNYDMLQEDFLKFQQKSKRQKEESMAVISLLKEKILLAEEHADSLKQELEDMIKCQFSEADLCDKHNKDNKEISVNVQVKTEDSEKIVPITSVIDPESTSLELDVVPFPAFSTDMYLAESANFSGSEQTISVIQCEKANVVKLLPEPNSHTTGSTNDNINVIQVCTPSTSKDDGCIVEINSSNDEQKYNSKFEQQMCQIRKLNDYIDELKCQVNSLSSETFELKNSFEKISSENKEISSQNLRLNEDVGELTHLRSDLQNELEEKKNFDNKIDDFLKFLEKALSICDADLNHENRLSKIKTHIINLCEKAGNINNDKIKQLEELNDSLKRENMKVLESLELERTSMTNAQSEVVSDLKNVIFDLETKNKNFDERISSFEEKEKNYESQIEKLSDLQNINKELLEKLQIFYEKENCLKKDYENRLVNLGSSILTIEREKADISNELSVIKLSHKGLTKEIESYQHKLEEMNKILLDKDKYLDSCINDEKNKCEREIDSVREECNERIQIIEKQKEEIKKLMENNRDILEEEYRLKIQNNQKECEKKIIQEKIHYVKALVSKTEEYEELVRERRDDIDNYKTQLSKLECKLDSASKLVQELEEKLIEKTKLTENLEKEIFEIRKECPKLEEQLEKILS